MIHTASKHSIPRSHRALWFRFGPTHQQEETVSHITWMPNPSHCQQTRHIPQAQLVAYQASKQDKKYRPLDIQSEVQPRGAYNVDTIVGHSWWIPTPPFSRQDSDHRYSQCFQASYQVQEIYCFVPEQIYTCGPSNKQQNSDHSQSMCNHIHRTKTKSPVVTDKLAAQHVEALPPCQQAYSWATPHSAGKLVS